MELLDHGGDSVEEELFYGLAARVQLGGNVEVDVRTINEWRTLGDVWAGVLLATERDRAKSSRRSDVFYAIWAKRLCGMTGSARANVRLAETFADDEPGLTGRKVAEYTRVARERCLYVPMGQGKAGGRMTAKGQRVLAESPVGVGALGQRDGEDIPER